ncbi:hypothetical protein ACRARG_03405 [Pseudooceanicola sp. C21-150M6]|uniref:hypothetical protein n=1 Tax=Pseudooceanicola sp. C21-150M6 TaxID=3434355 RepID=UPI003D7FD42A
MKTVRTVTLLAAASLALTACSGVRDFGKKGFWGNRPAFDGQYYRVKLASDKENRERFSVTVTDATKSLTGAREAARHRANEYCIEQFGLSEKDWDVSPDVDDAALPLTPKGDLVLSGECKGWL